MGRDQVQPFPRRVGAALLDAPSDEEHSQRAHPVLEWIAAESAVDPLSALSLLERVAGGVEAERLKGGYSDSGLTIALNAALRQADESDDGALIRRVIALQDWFLRLGYHVVEEMIEEAGRS